MPACTIEYPLLQNTYPIIISQCLYPVTEHIPYHRVYPLLQCVLPIAKYTPSYKVYLLVATENTPITKYTLYYKCASYYKVYPLLHCIPPNTKCTPITKCNPYCFQLQSLLSFTNCIPYCKKYVSCYQMYPPI